MRRVRLRSVVLLAIALCAAAVGGAAAVVVLGLYDVAASTQHTGIVYRLLETAMQRSVRLRARHIATPPLDDAALIGRGAACYRAHCVQCHGGPGTAPDIPGQAMQPVPGPLVDWRRRFRPRELYWITQNGIRMSGMPAWQLTLDNAQLWSVVAFVNQLPDLSADDFDQLATQDGARPRARREDDERECREPAGAQIATPPAQNTRPSEAPPADPQRGLRAIKLHACGSCHTVPGIVGSRPNVGPPLAGMARRTLIAGQLPNTPDNMVRWLVNPRDVDAHTAMPAMGLSPVVARDVAAYLATLH